MREADSGWRIADGQSAQPRASTPSLLHRDCANGAGRMDAPERPIRHPLSAIRFFHTRL